MSSKPRKTLIQIKRLQSDDTEEWSNLKDNIDSMIAANEGWEVKIRAELKLELPDEYAEAEIDKQLSLFEANNLIPSIVE